MDELGFPNDKTRKNLVKQTYDTSDNPIETVGVRYDAGRVFCGGIITLSLTLIKM